MLWLSMLQKLQMGHLAWSSHDIRHCKDYRITRIQNFMILRGKLEGNFGMSVWASFFKPIQIIYLVFNKKITYSYT